MQRFILLLVTSILFSNLAIAANNRVEAAPVELCAGADRRSREFTLDAVRGDIANLHRQMFFKGKLDDFTKKLKRQFGSLYDKEVYHSLSAQGLADARCERNQIGTLYFYVNRVLLYFHGVNGNATVLPVKVTMIKKKGEDWKVLDFASTAM